MNDPSHRHAAGLRRSGIPTATGAATVRVGGVCAGSICTGTICTILAVALWGSGISATEVPSDADVLVITHKHCVQCHAAEPTHEAFAKPPAGIMLETIEQIRRYAPRILDQVTVTRAMPLGNETGMTDEERDSVAAWIEGRK
jgi:uncharacterized membrane protein